MHGPKEGFFHELKSTYRHVWGIWQAYWRTYGGMRALLCSPYFLLSIILSLILSPFFSCSEYKWYEFSLSVLPNILGFTIGGYAILLAFGEEAFRRLLVDTKKNDVEPSAYLRVSASFVHFIFLQILSIVLSIICRTFAFNDMISISIGMFITLYALFSVMAATMQIFRLTQWYDLMIKKNQERIKQEKTKPEG